MSHDERKGMSALLDTALALGSTVDLDTLLRMIVSYAMELLDAERGSVFLYDAPREELYSRVAQGAGQIRFSIHKGFAGEAARNRQIINIPDAYADQRFNPEIDRQTGFKTRSILSFPLLNVAGELMGVMQVLNKRQGVFDDYDIHLAKAFAAQAGVAIQRSFLIEEQLEKQRLEHALELASEIQQRLFPQESPPIPGFDIACWNRPCEATGGDYCDLFDLNKEQLLISLGDVTGHGVGPALVSCATRSMIRALSQGHTDVESTLKTVNRMLNEDLSGGQFVTTFMGILDGPQRKLCYSSAGQGPLLWYHAQENQVEEFGADTLPLGIIDDLGKLPPNKLTMQKGDIFVLLTDGFYEWANQSKEQFGTERVKELITRYHDEKAFILLDTIRVAVEDFSQSDQTDDLTAIIVKAE